MEHIKIKSYLALKKGNERKTEFKSNRRDHGRNEKHCISWGAEILSFD